MAVFRIAYRDLTEFFFFLAFYGVTNISKSANGSAMTPEVNDAGQEFNFYFLFIPFF